MNVDFHATTLKLRKIALLGAISAVAFTGAANATTLEPVMNADDLISLVGHSHSTTCSHWNQAALSQKEQLLLGERSKVATMQGLQNGGTSGVALADGFAEGQVTKPASTGSNGTGTQVVYLDFDSATTGTYSRTFKQNADGTGPDVTVEFDEHIYTQEEREYIQARYQADYAQFNYQFVLEKPQDDNFSTVFFNANMPGEGADAGPAGINVADGGAITSITFGIADAIDFRNLNRGDNANVDGNVWALFSSSGFTATTGLADTPENRALATTIQSAQTGAHELGHIVGLRHYEAWGPIGEGLPTTGTPPDNAFLPTYTGPRNGDETTMHLMGSGASAGISLADSVVTDRFFSERSAIKLAFNEQGQIVEETDGIHDDFATAQEVRLEKLVVPNTIVVGDNAEARINVSAISIEGTIDEINQLDFYAFEGEEGDIFNLELISIVNENNLDFFDPILALFDEDFNLVAYSDDEFESADSFIFDFIMDYTGIIYAAVTSFDYSDIGLPQFSLGNYQLFVTRTRIPEPSAALLLVLALGMMVRSRRKKIAN